MTMAQYAWTEDAAKQLHRLPIFKLYLHTYTYTVHFYLILLRV